MDDMDDREHMTLRDRFAAAALTGLLANEDIRRDGRGTGVGTPQENAARAYALADAMLAEREKAWRPWQRSRGACGMYR